MTSALYKKVGLATLIMSLSILGSRVIGLVREMVIAHAGGVTGAVDAYQVSFIIPEILNHVAASGFLSITFIPIFTRYLADHNEAEGWRVFNTILTLCGALLLFFSSLAIWLAPHLVRFLAPGLTEPALRVEAIHMTRIIIPAQFFFFAGGLFTAVQFAKERFFLPALAPLIYNIGIIVGGLFVPSAGMRGFSYGVLGGAFLGNFVLQYWGARRVGLTWRLCFDWRHPALIRYIKLSLPLMVGLTMLFSTELFLKYFGSFLPRGGIAGLNYSLRVMLMLAGFFGQAVGVASFPFLARLAAEHKMDEMNRLLNNTLRYLTFVIPLAVLVMVLRHEMIRILFERGRFDAAATDMTADILACLMPGAFAFAAQTAVLRGFYAMQNTLFPALFCTAAVTCSLPLYIVGTRLFGAKGVALAIAFSTTFQVWLLYAVWNRKQLNPHSRELYWFIYKVVALSVPLGLLFEWIRRGLAQRFPVETGSGSWMLAGGVGIVFVMLFLGAAHLAGIDEVGQLVRRISNRMRSR